MVATLLYTSAAHLESPTQTIILHFHDSVSRTTTLHPLGDTNLLSLATRPPRLGFFGQKNMLKQLFRRGPLLEIDDKRLGQDICSVI